MLQIYTLHVLHDTVTTTALLTEVATCRVAVRSSNIFMKKPLQNNGQQVAAELLRKLGRY
jgi:hypothetical protein